MTLAVGGRVPDVGLKTMGPGGPTDVRTGGGRGAGTVVLFAWPGAFTPGCSKIHLPGYVARAQELLDKGVDTIACVSVNDPWVMAAWAEQQGSGDSILLLADGNAEFTP